MAYERKDIRGNAAATTLSNPIDDDDETIVIADATNWPGDNSLPFVISIARGTALEETVLCESRSGTTITVRASTGRGHDGTTAYAHSAGVAVEHVADAETIDQVNRLANLLTTKGDIFAHNGTNPVRLGSGSTDGFVFQRKDSEATGLVCDRLVTLLAQAGAPAVAGYVRLWFDTTNRLLRASDGSSWQVPTQLPTFASSAARDALFSSPVAGNACWRSDLGFPEIYTGTKWAPLGVPSFASNSARNAYYSSPADGDQAYVTGDHMLYVYRNNEWVLISNKTVVSASLPANLLDGDLWLQPVD